MLDGVVVSDVPAEPLPPIMKMCRCCEEVRPHVRKGSAIFDTRFRGTSGICAECDGAGLRLGADLYRTSVSMRRQKRDESVAAKALRAERAARGVAWCSAGKHEAPIRHMKPASPSKLAEGAAHASACRSCHRASNARRAPLTGMDLHEDNEARYKTWLGLQDAAVRSTLGIRARDRRQTDISVECAKVGAEPGHVNTPIPEAPTAQQVSALTEQKKSRQVRRAEKRRAEKDAAAEEKRRTFEQKLAALDASSKQRAKGGEKKGGKRRELDIDAGAVSRNLHRAQNGLCPYTGLDLETAAATGNPLLQPSKDQRVAGKGYTSGDNGNAVLTPLALNYLKNKFSEREAIEALKALAQSLIDTGRWQPRLRQLAFDL